MNECLVRLLCVYQPDEGEIVTWKVKAEPTEEMTLEEAAAKRAHDLHLNKYSEETQLVDVTVL